MLVSADGLPTGEWASIRRRYLEEEKPELFEDMRKKGTLGPHLQEIENYYGDLIWDYVDRQMEHEGIDNDYKRKDFLGYVGMMNNIKASIKERFIAEICR